MVRKNWILGIIAFIFLISSLSVGAYCNETIEVIHTNTSAPSSDYNQTITRTCSSDFEVGVIGTGIIIGVIMFFFFAIGYVYSKEESFMFYLCYLFWYIALFFPLYALRIAANVEGISTRVKLLIETLYSVYLRIYWVLIIILAAYFIVLFFSWLWFWHKKPAWKRKKLEV